MVQDQIISKLEQAFHIEHLEVLNESHMHSGPKSDTHFKVILVTEDFSGLNKVKQHQAVYQVLSQELAAGVHALALHTYDLQAWTQVQMQAPDSPNCMGGSKK